MKPAERRQIQQTPTQNRHKHRLDGNTRILCLCSYFFIKFLVSRKIHSQAKLHKLCFFAPIAANCIICAFVHYLRGEPGENRGGPENWGRTGERAREQGEKRGWVQEEPGENLGLSALTQQRIGGEPGGFRGELFESRGESESMFSLAQCGCFGANSTRWSLCRFVV